MSSRVLCYQKVRFFVLCAKTTTYYLDQRRIHDPLFNCQLLFSFPAVLSPKSLQNYRKR